MEINRVFVYGTLMKGESNHGLVKPFIKGVRPGKTEGIICDLPYGYPAMAVGEGVVSGEVLELENMEEALERLDGLEDYRGPGNPQDLYDRVTREVEVTAGEKVTAYLYLWAHPNQLVELGTAVPGGDFEELQA